MSCTGHVAPSRLSVLPGLPQETCPCPPTASQTCPRLPLTSHGLSQQGFLNFPSCNWSGRPDQWSVTLGNSKAVSQDTAATAKVISHEAPAQLERWPSKIIKAKRVGMYPPIYVFLKKERKRGKKRECTAVCLSRQRPGFSPWHRWHPGLANSLLWGLSCALQDS